MALYKYAYYYLLLLLLLLLSSRLCLIYANICIIRRPISALDGTYVDVDNVYDAPLPVTAPSLAVFRQRFKTFPSPPVGARRANH